MKSDDITSEKTKCPYCNEFVPNTKYCISCGNILQDRSIIKPKNEISDLSDDKTNIDINKSICPLCRSEIPSEHNFCHLCGGKLKKKPLDKQKQRIICNRCWKPNPPNLDYCIHCGMKQQIKRSKLLEKPFDGYQMDLSEFFQPINFPMTMIKQSLITSSPIFPSKSTIIHSNYFGVYKSRMNTVNKLYRNLGGFNSNNLANYLFTFILMIFIYFFWFSSRYAPLNIETDIITDGFFIIFFGGIVMTSLLMLPVWLSTFLVYRNTGFRLNFRIESSRVFTTIIFNLLWMFFGYGPIFLRLGEFQDPKQRIISNKSFIKGISLGSVIVVFGSIFFAILSIAVIGIPGEFTGFLFKNSPLKSHIITSYFGSIWISIILLFPLGDYYDKVIKRWNQIAYFILLSISFLLLLNSFTLMNFLSQLV
ncbi:MAG: zinc ribbon domain-containing protein [Candidatus Hodarchaeota archaeon]